MNTTSSPTSTNGAGDAAQAASKGLGFGRLFHDLWFKRRKHRQFAGIALVLLLTAVGAPSRAAWIAGAVVVTVGMLVRLWASGVVVKNEILATTGPYGFVRHPLYVGNVLIGVGFCLASGLWWSWIAFALLFLYFYPHTIRYEDQKLQRLFGEPWVRWSAATRALLPRLTPYVDDERSGAVDGGDAGPSWSFRLSMARNGEPVHILVGVLCLWYLHAQIV